MPAALEKQPDLLHTAILLCLASHNWVFVERRRFRLRDIFPWGFRFSRTGLLVREGMAFYNPSIASMVAVISFTHHSETPKRTVVRSVSKNMVIDPHFGNSQEH
ncbi:MAG: hypothetical protein ABR976_11435 [Terracidiphilus sp.]